MSDNNREWTRIVPARTHTFHTKLSDGSMHVEVISMPRLKLNAHVRTLPTANGAALLSHKVYVSPAGIAKLGRGVSHAGFSDGASAEQSKPTKLVTAKHQVKKGKK